MIRVSPSFACAAALAALALASGCARPPEPAPAAPPAPQPVAVDAASLALFAPLPAVVESASNPISAEKTQLGRMLFHEKRLSKSQEIACSSCHDLARYGVDNKPTSDGHKGQKGGRNSPTVCNAAGHVAQFWDGRAADVEAQAKGPILNPIEMAMPAEPQVIAVLTSMPEYVDAFKAAFPADENPVTYDNMARAIGAYERQIVTPSRWDRFLAGDRGALTDDETKGFNQFVSSGCVACHSGTYVGGGMFQKLGLVAPFPDLSDEGRFAVTKNEVDKFVFKVPSLRNIEKTGPYFHDGKVGTLDEAARLMARHQVGRELTDAEAASIVCWLKSLTGELPRGLVAAPALPPSTARTPKPDLT